MLTEFERLARQFRNDPCFYFVDKDGQTRVFSYEEVRSHAAALAFLLYEKGAIRGSYVFVDMANCPAFIFLALAAAYGGFVLVALNHRLTEEEKAMRTVELHSMNNLRVVTQLSEAGVCRLLAKALFLEEDASAGRGGLFRKKKPEHLDPVFRQKSKVFHWLERAVAFYDGKATALVLFTSGTSGRPKAVPLSWDNLSGSAEASNTSLSIQGEGMWQAALPLFHIGGFQIPLRSVLNGRPFVLYRSFNADRILLDAQQFQASHISVVDKMLQALLASPHSAQLQEYRCILLGGAAPNPRTMVEARGHGLRVYVSYGMTETSSQVASSLADEHYDGACTLLPGYEAQVVAPDERGFGQLALRGPGVFAGYLNGSAAFTVDGFFLTGDSASIQQGRIKVAERFDDMFVSGGENVYPAEIQDRLLRIAGVSDAYVFGVEDEVWGRRPVALLERGRASARRGDIDSLDESGFWQDTQAGEPGGEDAGPGAETLLSESATPQAFAAEVAKSLEQRLSKINRPRHICVMDSFPRVGLGKPDCTKLRQSYEERLEIREVRLYHIEQRFVNPITTSKTVLRSRESLIVELIDWAGRSGIGECLAFPTDFYLSETLGQDRRVMEATLIPAVLSQIYLHPREASACFDECAQAEFFPMAKAAIEPALWDLYGKITGQALWQLIGGGIEEASGDGSEASGDDSDISGDGSEALLWTRPPCLNPSPQSLAVAAGATFGIATIPQTLEAVGLAVSQGYARVKLKIQPGDDIERVRALRDAFPRLQIILDANQSYTEADLGIFQALDELDICCIEEPLNPEISPQEGPSGIFERLAALQKTIRTKIALDESWADAKELEQALAFPQLRCVVLKIGKLGGVAPALECYERLQERGVEVWMGGMFETSISKRLHAAFQTLPGIAVPGDLSSASSYFKSDIAIPPFEVEGGSLLLNPAGFEFGLGCELNHAALAKLLVSSQTFTR